MGAKHVVFITGANTGIGFEAVKALANSPQPYHIFLGSRSLVTGKEAIEKVNEEFPQTSGIMEPVEVELTSDDSIAKAAEYIKSKVDRIDSLVNNAGAAFDTLDFATDVTNTREIFNKAYDVNVTGTQVLTAALVPLLLKSSSPRLIFLTSGMSTLTGLSKTFLPPQAPRPKAGWPKEGLALGLGYKSSKTALNMVMLNWHWLLLEDGVKTFAISPGFLATNLAGDPAQMKASGAGDASLGGDIIRRVVEGERDTDAGKVLNQAGKVQDW